jgi:hypothetical protein
MMIFLLNKLHLHTRRPHIPAGTTAFDRVHVRKDKQARVKRYFLEAALEKEEAQMYPEEPRKEAESVVLDRLFPLFFELLWVPSISRAVFAFARSAAMLNKVRSMCRDSLTRITRSVEMLSKVV